MGGVIVDTEKVWALAYADDLVILTTEENSTEEMMQNLGIYISEIEKKIYVEKTKFININN